MYIILKITAQYSLVVLKVPLNPNQPNSGSVNVASVGVRVWDPAKKLVLFVHDSYNHVVTAASALQILLPPKYEDVARNAEHFSVFTQPPSYTDATAQPE